MQKLGLSGTAGKPTSLPHDYEEISAMLQAILISLCLFYFFIVCDKCDKNAKREL
jgi:hypothetical protein